MTAQKNQSFIAVVAKSIGNGLTEFSGYGIQTSARASARALGTEWRESYRWKLFHREERPALKRNIIDTSELARASYRYVIGQHFGL